MIDKIETKLKYILKTFILILLFLFFPYLPVLLLKIEFKNPVILFTIMNILLIIIFILVYKKDIKRDFKNYFNKDINNNIKTSLKYWVIGLIAMIVTNIIIAFIIENNMSQNEQLVREYIDKMPLYMLFETIIYAPIIEEIIFRKSIKDIISNKYIYILLSGLLFGGMHVVDTISSAKELLFIIPYSVVGMSFAACYHKTNNIFSTIVAHSVHNTLTLSLYLLTRLL